MTRVALIALALGACNGPVANLDPTGILLVGIDDRVQSGPPNEAVGNAFSLAFSLAESNGIDLGYPWIDPANGDLVLSVVTSRGRDLVQAASISVPHRIRQVAHGATELRRIQDDVTFLGTRGVAGAELIYMTVPDHRDNRAMIVISSMSRPLLDYLAAHYPADALAVAVGPPGS